MSSINVRAIRAAIESGASDEEIIDGIEASEFSLAAYGHPDEPMGEGPSYLNCDDTYRRNEAGEWLAFM